MSLPIRNDLTLGEVEQKPRVIKHSDGIIVTYIGNFVSIKHPIHDEVLVSIHPRMKNLWQAYYKTNRKSIEGVGSGTFTQLDLVVKLVLRVLRQKKPSKHKLVRERYRERQLDVTSSTKSDS